MWKRLSTKVVLDHPRLIVEEDEVLLPNGRKARYLRYKNPKEAVGILCIVEGKVLMQKEYSYPPDKVMCQLPGGAVEVSDKSLEAAANRELQEESGLSAGPLKKLGEYYVDNRRSNKKIHIYLATDCRSVKKSGGDQEEDISSEWISVSDFRKMIASGEVQNGPLLVAWAFYQNMQPK